MFDHANLAGSKAQATRKERAPRALSWAQARGDLTESMDGEYRFDPVDAGTLVTYDLEVELQVPIPAFIKARAAQRIQGQALAELKSRAESLR